MPEKETAHDHKTHADHDHDHGPGCGHTAIRHGDHVDEHVIEVSDTNPDGCATTAAGHAGGHAHGPDCGHEAVPHGDHVDYLVDGRLHHPHGDHCDDHGPVEIVPTEK